MERQLTERQREILDFINRHTLKAGWPPTFREIAGHFGVYISTVQDHIEALKAKGFISREKDVARGIKVLGGSFAPQSPGIPVLGAIPAGDPREEFENAERYVHTDPSLMNNADYALRVKGDSMAPEIVEGDIVLVKKTPHASSGDIVIAVLEGWEGTVKRMRASAGEKWLEPANPAYKPIKKRSFEISGKVVGLLRSYDY